MIDPLSDFDFDLFPLFLLSINELTYLKFSKSLSSSYWEFKSEELGMIPLGILFSSKF